VSGFVSLQPARSIPENAGVAMKSAEKGASGADSSGRECAMPTAPQRKSEAVAAEQSGVGLGAADKRLRRIRARSSYRLFRELHEFLEGKPDVAAILRKLYGLLDAKGCFGSRTNGGYAAQSLAQVLSDMGDVYDRRDSEVV